jgi:DNA-binding transcriptional regulator YiaG
MNPIKELCIEFGLNQSELSRRFDIPLRTIQDWHAGRRVPPAYVVNMMRELLRIEHGTK